MFLYYFVPTVAIVLIMLGRIGLLKAGMFFVHAISDAVSGASSRISANIMANIRDINSQQMVFFTRGDNLAALNQAVLYVRGNEHTNRIKIVTIGEDESKVPVRLAADIRYLDEAYPKIDLEFVFVKGRFSPELIQDLSKQWNIPVNFMFIGSPGHHFLYGLAELGGVRLII